MGFSVLRRYCCVLWTILWVLGFGFAPALPASGESASDVPEELALSIDWSSEEGLAFADRFEPPDSDRDSLDARGPWASSGSETAPQLAAMGVDDHWDGRFTTLGTDGAVYALVVGEGGDLYIGGGFTTVGGVSASNVARWDGSTWSPLGSGTGDEVWTLALDGDGNLYAGGVFTTAGGVNVNHVARWNGDACGRAATGRG
jgi:hypothetical protein